MTKEEKVLGFLKEEAKVPLNLPELSVILGVPEEDRGELFNILEGLVKNGEIIKTKRARYGAPKALGLVRGRFSSTERGFGFVMAEDGGEDIFIPSSSRGCALSDDIVLVKLDEKRTGNRRSGAVQSVVRRNSKPFVAELQKRGKSFFAVCSSKKMQSDIYIAKDKLLGAVTGDIVVVEITKFDNPEKNPEGRITEVIGRRSDLGIDILSLAKEHSLRTDFPEKVLNAAREIPDEISNEELSKRLDLRDKTIVTIDGADVKDLDDAVSLEMTENGLFKLGVHIADVGHYVKWGSALDKEAFKRGTSVYLTDRVIPMLPKELSNGICSLNPNVDRLTLSVFMEIDEKGNIKDYEIKESVINSKERMTYSDVTAICSGNRELSEKYASVADMLKLMERLKEILSKKRKRRGSIDLDIPETKVYLDEEGRAIAVEKYEQGMSNHIIEEFMLAANEVVAEHMFWQNVPFLYRVHETPSDEKVSELAAFVGIFGHSLKRTAEKIHSKEFQKLIEKTKGTKEERIISTMLLRSMQKAKYTHENLGHFGLAARFYTHFTSPIRRYPDLVIHRIIKETLHGEDVNNMSGLYDFVVKVGTHSTDAEISAMEAERDCRDMKTAEYMSQFVGEEFKGVISSVTSFGIFVELENTVEGFVSMTELHDDYYIFDDATKSLVGKKHKNVLRIGDELTVTLIKAEKESRRIDFAVLE